MHSCLVNKKVSQEGKTELEQGEIFPSLGQGAVGEEMARTGDTTWINS